ncbi:MAG: hypothetical protein GEU91_20045 [Rhizobiales bacterium]|nr:hypothetical protein [Hyphomicrobiales bacterium]
MPDAPLHVTIHIDAGHIPLRLRGDWLRHVQDFLRPLREPEPDDLNAAITFADTRTGMTVRLSA